MKSTSTLHKLRYWISMFEKAKTRSQLRNALEKVKYFIKQLRFSYSSAYLRKVTASVTLLLGTMQVNAQTFGDPVFLTTIQDTWITNPCVEDLDGDGDMDMMAFVYFDNYLELPTRYLENQGSNLEPDFVELEEPFGFDYMGMGLMYSPTLADLDRDGDLDLVGSDYSNSNRLVWQENVGDANNPEFTSVEILAPEIDSDAPIGISPYDIDNDGDLDVLFISYADYYTYPIFYLENTLESNGELSFNPTPILTNIPFLGLNVPLVEANVISRLLFSDFDLDGDMDIATIANTYGVDEYGEFVDYYGFTLAYLENQDGVYTDWAILPQINVYEAENNFFGFGDLYDIDDDGDMDIIYTLNEYEDYENSQLYYLENRTLTDTNDIVQESHFKVMPTISSDQITIELEEGHHGSIQVRDMLGKIVWTSNADLSQTITLDISSWRTGTYVIQSSSLGKSQLITKI